MRYLVLAVAFGLLGCSSPPPKSAAPADNKPIEASVVQKTVSATIPAAPSKPSCTKGSETRVFEIVKTEKGCVLNYTKFGKTASVATSTHGVRHCEKAKDKIRAKLEKAGYQCSST